MNVVFNPPSVGTAPFDEIGSHYDRTKEQRDDREATMPAEDLQNRSPGLPDGFRWSKTAAGKPTIVPTQDNINKLFELANDVFADREQRDEELPPDVKMNRALNALQKQLALGNDFLASGMAYQLVRAYQAEFASAMNWVRIHAEMIERHSDNGNEAGAENSLINFESSRQQALKIAQLLDWCEEQGADVNLMKGCQDALGLAGWRLMNQQASQNRKAVQRTTRDLFWSRGAKQPDQEIEDAEDKTDF